MRLDRRSLLAGGAAALLWPRPGGAAEPTRLRIAGDRVFIPIVVNGRRVEALLDSAAEASFLDTRFAAALGLEAGVPATARGSGAGIAAARLVRGVEIVAAGLTLRPAAVGVTDLSDVSRRLAQRDIAMVLGRELFDAARLAIDLVAGTLAVLPRQGVPPGVRLPLTAEHGVECVPVSIEGQPGLAEFDLGNGGRVLIGQAFARRHGLLSDARPRSTIGGGGIGGEVTQVAFSLRGLDVAGHHFADVPVAVDANGNAADANIGVRVLRQFRIVTDFAASAVWLAPRL